ncbi:MAG: hypothetical protein O2794_02895 [bacterium]|nr:hypothetical protein [bacterium]
MTKVKNFFNVTGRFLLRYPLLVGFLVVLPFLFALVYATWGGIGAVFSGGAGTGPVPIPTRVLTSLEWGWMVAHVALFALFYCVYRHRPSPPEKEFDKDGEPRLHYLGTDGWELRNEYCRKIRETLNILVGYFIILWAVELSSWPISSFWLPRWPVATAWILITPLVAGGFLSYYVDWTKSSSRRALWAFYAVASVIFALSLTFGWMDAQDPVAETLRQTKGEILEARLTPLEEKAELLREAWRAGFITEDEAVEKIAKLREIHQSAEKKFGNPNPLADVVVPEAEKVLGKGGEYIGGEFSEFFGPFVNATPSEYRYLWFNPFFWGLLIIAIAVFAKLATRYEGVRTFIAWMTFLAVCLVLIIVFTAAHEPGGLARFSSEKQTETRTDADSVALFSHHRTFDIKSGDRIRVWPKNHPRPNITGGDGMWYVTYAAGSTILGFEMYRSGGMVVQAGTVSGPAQLPNNFYEMDLVAQKGAVRFTLHCNGCTYSQ